MKFADKCNLIPLIAVFCCCLPACSGERDRDGEEIMSEPRETVVRHAVGAGRWFPGDKRELADMIDGFIDAAATKGDGGIVSAIAPHAGYIYSGKVAGYTFRAIRDSVRKNGKPDTVVVAGFSHSASFKGVALMDGDVLRTPLGDAVIDLDANRALASSSERIFEDYSPHNGEHSAENEVPFIQAVLPDAKIVMALMGDHDGQTVEEFVAALKELAATKKILFIASTDLLHDADFDKVTDTDRKTVGLIAGLEIQELAGSWSMQKQVCCGIMPVITAMRFAEEMGCEQGKVLYVRNSGDDFPESKGDWVVGYASIVFALE